MLETFAYRNSNSSRCLQSCLRFYKYFCVIILLNSIYHRPTVRLYSRRIAALSKDESTEYRSLWRCCQPPKLVFPHPPHSQEFASLVKNSRSASGRVVGGESMLSSAGQCIGGDQQILQSASRECACLSPIAGP